MSKAHSDAYERAKTYFWTKASLKQKTSKQQLPKKTHAKHSANRSSQRIRSTTTTTKPASYNKDEAFYAA